MKMMNDSTKYNRIRDLIARWYDGNTTAEEEHQIRSFFNSTDIEALPDDLRQEAMVFGTLDGITTEFPDNELLAEIEAEVAREQQPAKPRRRLGLRLAAIAASAAAVAILLVAGFHKGTNTGTGDISPVKVAEADTTAVEMPRTPGPETQNIALNIEESHESVAPEKRVRTPRQIRNQAPAEAIAQTTDPYGYTEIDDPEEAARILAEVDNRYSRAMAMSTKAIVETDNALQYTREIIRSAIDNS